MSKEAMIAVALFDFMGWLTTRPKRIMLSSADDASPAVDAIKEFAKMRGLSLDDAQVQDWQEALAEQPAQQEPLTDEEIWREYKFLWPFHPAEEGKLASDVLMFARAIEAAHGIKENT